MDSQYHFSGIIEWFLFRWVAQWSKNWCAASYVRVVTFDCSADIDIIDNIHGGLT